MVQRSRGRPLAHSSTNRRRPIQPFPLSTRHQLSDLLIRKPCRHHLRCTPSPRRAPPPLLQLTHVITSLSLISPSLHLLIRAFLPLDHPLSHTNSMLRNTKVSNRRSPLLLAANIKDLSSRCRRNQHCETKRHALVGNIRGNSTIAVISGNAGAVSAPSAIQVPIVLLPLTPAIVVIRKLSFIK